MNESASNASLAPSSGKPSTAISTGSPNGHKTRTIIVARTILDEPAKVAPAATRGEGHINGATAVVNQHHSRDARSGKLASYAALGGAEDVERFDKFLTEQRGQPSASELRAAATSPHHVMASMKRKTMSRIQLEGIDGKPTDAEPAGGDAAARKFMQQEMENDVRQRREEVVAHRKWLNSLPIHEQVAQQRQQNALRKWRQMSRDWETFKARAARRLGKAPQELVMSRAAAYREQREMYDALQKARPLSDKVGGDIWLVSLRNEGTRYVPVGNIFSGLFCPIRESTKLGTRVRRPLDYHGSQGNRDHEASRPLSKLEKRSLSLLARKKWRLRKQLEVIQPHEVDQSASSHLAIETTDLFAWASGATNEAGIDSDDEGSVRTYSASVDEASRHHRLRSYPSPSSPKSVTNGAPSNNQFTGPSIRIAHVADDDDAPDSTPESGGILSGNNPEVCHPPLRLSFYTPVGEQEQRSLSVTNDGNTVVHYQWWRAPFDEENGELATHLRGHRTRREEQELERFMTTSVSELGGTLLPGETQRFVFTFESSKPGVYLEKWLLDADPQPRVCFGAIHLDADADSSAELPVEVRLSCVAEDNFVAWRRREMQLRCVEQRESHFFVANIVDEVLDGVRPPEPVVFNELTPRDDVTKFYEHNGSNDFSDVYFSPDLVRDYHALYERAQGILRALWPKQTPVIENENPSNEDAGDIGAEGAEKLNEVASVALPEQNGSGEGANAETELQQETSQCSPLPVHLVQDWDWRLETLRELCKKADEAQNVQIGRLIQQLKNENHEDEEDEEADEADDEDADSEEEDSENGDIGTLKSTPLSAREVRKIERLAQREALENEITALQPDLEETFEAMRFSACTAPYTSTRLQERLHERIGSLCSETPVVCEIAKAMNAGNNSSVVQAAKVEGVGKLLMRAIDEAIGGDQDHQALFEQERRRIQCMWLGDKLPYSSVSQWVVKEEASMSLPLVASSTETTDNPPTPQNIEHVDRSGVVLMQVDLDLAPWFSLVKTEAKEAAASVDGASFKTELAWRFSQELTQHATFVPAKAVQAAESLRTLLNALASAKPVVHTIVLVSTLRRPPLTKQMLKLLRSAAQTELKAIALAANPTTGDTEEGKPQEGEEHNEEAEAAIMKSLLKSLAPQLSLRSVAKLVQRAIQRDVVFCDAVEEVQSQIEFSRKELLLSSSASLGVTESEALSKEGNLDADPQGVGMSPRILLLEHLDAAGIDLVTHAFRKRELAKPATPVPPEPQKPAAGGKKASVAVPAKGKPGTTGTSAAPVPAPPVKTLPTSIRDLTKPEFAGKDLSEQGANALRNQFARMVSACVLDAIPSQPCEGAFAFAPKKDDRHLPLPIFAGPILYKELTTWSQTLQPILQCNAQPRILTAIVGGKCLESKLRLIDGLIEFVDEIYFVGEVAMSLYRVLHRKQMKIAATHSHIGMKHEEESEELEEDADGSQTDRGIKEEIPEEEANEPGIEKEPGHHLLLDKARPMGLWDLFVPAVEKLQQKASRKCVRLLLPIDWIVGETPLEEQDFSAAAVIEDEDDDGIDTEESDENTSDSNSEEVGGKKSRKRKASQMKSARQKPLVEPDHADVFEQKRHVMYEGERAHVVLSHASSKRLTAPDAGWRTFQDVTAQCLSDTRVVEGKSSVLTSLWLDLEGDDADDEGNDGAIHKPSPAKFEYEWTFRALDVGPIAMEALTRLLNEPEDQRLVTDVPTHSRVVIVNGTCGAVEFHEFCAATKQLLKILQDYNPSDVFIAGSSTASWLQQLEIEQLNNVATSSAATVATVAPTRMRKVVDYRTMRNARVLKQIVAAKPHPIISSLATSDSI